MDTLQLFVPLSSNVLLQTSPFKSHFCPPASSFPLSSHAPSSQPRRRDIPAIFRNDFHDSSALYSLRERRSGTDSAEKRGDHVSRRLSLSLSESSAVAHARLGSTLIPILSAQTPTFPSTGTRSARQSSCPMPKQMTNHVTIWPFFIAFK